MFHNFHFLFRGYLSIVLLIISVSSLCHLFFYISFLSDSFLSSFISDFHFEVFFRTPRLIVASILATPYPRYSASSVRSRSANRRRFLLGRRCPPLLLSCLFLPILPRLFGRPGWPVTSRPRSRVSKLRRGMSVYCMRGIISSSEGNQSIIPR